MQESLAAAEAERVIMALDKGQKAAYAEYMSLVDSGLARELARVNLPLSMYTEWYWQIDLHNLFRFLALRLDAHAQREIRDYASVVFDVAKNVCPLACASFERHLLGGVRLSIDEAAAFRRVLQGKEAGLAGRELERLLEKLRP